MAQSQIIELVLEPVRERGHAHACGVAHTAEGIAQLASKASEATG